MTLSQATVVQRIRRHLGEHPWEDSSCSAVSASSTITGATTGFWVKGDIGEFVEDGDRFLTISESGGTITAIRSYDGATGAIHSSARVLKNPTYPYDEITNAVSSVIQAWLPWPRAYKVVGDTITPDPAATVWYDLASDALALVSVIQRTGVSNEKLTFYGQRHAQPRVQFGLNLPSGLVASGVGVAFPDGFSHATNTVAINYAAKVTDTVTTGSYVDLTDGDALTEAVIYGAVALLQGSLELRRPRKPSPDTEVMRGAMVFQRMFADALAHAERELRVKYPLMRMPDGSL